MGNRRTLSGGNASDYLFSTRYSRDLDDEADRNLDLAAEIRLPEMIKPATIAAG
jgi:hypothetical protein